MRSGFRIRGGVKDVLYSYGAYAVLALSIMVIMMPILGLISPPIVLANGNSVTVVKPQQTILEYCTFNWSPTSIYAGQTAYFQAQCTIINIPLPIVDGFYAMYIQDPYGPAFNPQPQITAWYLPYLTSQPPSIQYTTEPITIYWFGMPNYQIPAYSWYYYAGPVIFVAPPVLTWYINGKWTPMAPTTYTGCVYTFILGYAATNCNNLVVNNNVVNPFGFG